MKQLGNKNLIKLLLKSSPRTLAKQVNAKFVNSPVKLNSLISNRGYINMFLTDIGCEHLIFPVEDIALSQKYPPIFIDKSASKQTNLLEIIRKTQRANVSLIILVEVEQKIQMLSSQQSVDNLKYLIFLEKQLIRNQKKLPQRLLEMNKSLIATIRNKIYEGASRVAQMKQSKNQLGKVLLLTQARKSKEIGDIQTARSKYEQIYNDESMKEQVRLQALEYLCTKSIQKGDKNYLEEMHRSLQVKGIQKDKEVIKKYMQLIQNQRPL